MREILSAAKVSEFARGIVAEVLPDAATASCSDHQLACRAILNHDFCPPNLVRHAAVTLARPERPIEDPVFREKIALFRLEEFCLRFYSLPLAERKQICETLSADLREFPALSWRLQWIETALPLSLPAPDEKSPADRLAQDLCEIHVLPPRSGAAALRRLCDTAMREDQGIRLRVACRELSRQLTPVSKLGAADAIPGILRLLTPLRQSRLMRLRGKLTRAFLPADTSGYWSSPKRIGITIVVGILVAIVRGMDSSRYEPPSRTAYPAFRQTELSQSQFADARKALQDALSRVRTPPQMESEFETFADSFETADAEPIAPSAQTESTESGSPAFPAPPNSESAENLAVLPGGRIISGADALRWRDFNARRNLMSEPERRAAWAELAATLGPDFDKSPDFEDFLNEERQRLTNRPGPQPGQTAPGLSEKLRSRQISHGEVK